jgi:phosphoribosylamine---glycine ligase
MRVLVVGGGGREHALAWKLSQSSLVREIFVAPGNGGTARMGSGVSNVLLKDDDIPALVDFAKDRGIDLVIPGPELPLVLGLSDALQSSGIPCFGPNAFAAQLEGSKAFAKRLMLESGVPTAVCEVFEDYDEARRFIERTRPPMVVKADGLAAGKGVVVARSHEEAIQALDNCMVKKIFGKAGSHVIVEQALTGQEASFLAFCDGENVLCLPSAQDHKPVGEGDTGPNTGGMGAYSPAPILPESQYQQTANLTIRPIVRRLAELERPFVGMLYAGLMIDGPAMNVLEYNVRFGDPECQPLLMRLENDLAELMLASVEGRLRDVTLRIRPETSVCVVLSAGGYPGEYAKGAPISGIEEAERLGNVKVFHAGTQFENGQVVTSGGRVLGVTALGKDLGEAQELAYAAVDKIHFENMYCRRDIGSKGLA